MSINPTKTAPKSTCDSHTTPTRVERNIELVTLPERFDAFASVDLPDESLPAGTSIVVDARAVRFADLRALQSLVDARLVALDAGGDLIIGAPSTELRVILELTGFDMLLTVISGGAR